MTRTILNLYNLAALARWAWGVVAGALVLVLLLTSCAPRSARREVSAAENQAVRTVMYLDGSERMPSIQVDRYVMDDGVICYRYWSTGGDGWSCVRVPLEVSRATDGPVDD